MAASLGPRSVMPWFRRNVSTNYWQTIYEIVDFLLHIYYNKLPLLQTATITTPPPPPPPPPPLRYYYYYYTIFGFCLTSLYSGYYSRLGSFQWRIFWIAGARELSQSRCTINNQPTVSKL